MGFEAPLKVKHLGPKRWRLMAPLPYRASDGTRYTAPLGFVTDFASVPRLPLAYLLTGNTAHKAAAVHDYLYDAGITSRKRADQVFREAMRDSGVPYWRRAMMYRAVRAGGWLPWNRYRRRDADQGAA
ncbi:MULTISPECIES: DUF1353 domain-containing protein [unclassified Thioalkalivibrio]|uniref:DUF1353 domain-containing protein n=1 Tax=unclassified Thioalkalivibrio TaxID=2621013 RepID=UPI000365891E|nr:MULTISPECIES: DUF1353 domain-containing protein [unclassified Thioalkalivibrio]